MSAMLRINIQFTYCKPISTLFLYLGNISLLLSLSPVQFFLKLIKQLDWVYICESKYFFDLNYFERKNSFHLNQQSTKYVFIGFNCFRQAFICVLLEIEWSWQGRNQNGLPFNT